MESPTETTEKKQPEPSGIQSLTRLFRDYPGQCVVGLVVALLIIAWIAPQTFIHLLKVLISWPLIVGIAIVVFRQDIGYFIRYLVVKYRTKGGDELRLYSQAEASAAEAAEANGMKEPDPANTKALKDQVDKLINVAAGLEEEKKQIIQRAADLLGQQGDAVVYWWFQYLSLFLVFETKFVLLWFSEQRTGISFEFYQAYWRKGIPDPEELKAVFLALHDHGLIAPDESGLFCITETGRNFLDFERQRGFPGVPPSSQNEPTG